MLTYLQIRDFAIIEAIELELQPGLTVLTGETGAGKSIIVDALELIAGARAGVEVVRHGADRAELSASFSLAQSPVELKRWLEAQSIPAEQELTVRRIVTSDGRARAYLNGQAVPLQQLRELGNLLLDIHGQHEFQSLTRATAQRELLDAYGGLESLSEQVAVAHRVWLALLNRTLELESQARDRDSRLALLRYQVQELEALAISAEELASLTEERGRLANRGRLAQSAQSALAQLFEAEQGSAHDTASRALGALRSVSSLDPKIGPILTSVDAALIQLVDAARELKRYVESLEVDADRQEQVERRLAAVEELARKHRIAAEKLPQHAHALAAERAVLESAEGDLSTLRKDLSAALTRYRELANQLSARRATAARALGKEITARMQTLGMAGGRLQVDVAPLESTEPEPHGADQIEFRVSANPGQPLRPLAKVASGGELSRLALAVQVSCAAHTPRCMIFDEVDAGVGGAVAEIVGRELRALAASGQVLCVTHLPQVASQGHRQLRVSKLTDGRTTRISAHELAAHERIEELARMLGGIEVTAKAREHAREMLKRAEAEQPAVRSPSSETRSSAARSGRRE